MWAIWASFGFPAFCANAPLVERHMAAVAATRRIDMKSSLPRPTALPRLLESTPAWMRLGPIRFPVKEFKSSGMFHPFATSKAGTGGALVSRLALKLLHQKFNDGRGENQTFTRKALLAKLLRGPRLSLVLNECFEEDSAIVYREACKLGCEGRNSQAARCVGASGI